MPLYVSFGQKYNLRSCLMKFDSMTEEEVRKYMNDVYQNRYCMVYSEESALEQIQRFGLSVVEPGTRLIDLS